MIMIYLLKNLLIILKVFKINFKKEPSLREDSFFSLKIFVKINATA